MADTKISALTAASAAAAANEFAINEAGTSKKLTLDQIETYLKPVIAGNSGAVADRIGTTTLQRLTANNSDIPTTTLVDQLTATGINAGWWLVEYFIIWQSNVTTTGIAFNVDHSGTAANSQYTRLDATSSATALATVGIADQDAPTSSGVGWLPSNWAVRADATDLGPNAGVDTINVNQISRVFGLLLVTGNGNLVLKAKSEVASTITRIAAGTTARYTRLS